MQALRVLFYTAIIVVAMLRFSGAITTVSLTGICSSNTINATNHFLQFSLHNSGNGFASNLDIVPIFHGFSTSNAIETIPELGPNSSAYFSFDLYNFSLPGSYVESFVAYYQQGSSSFSTMYSCLVNVGSLAPSMLTISSGEFKNDIINVSIINLASYPINATVEVYAPPSSFKINNSIVNVSFSGYASKSIMFKMIPPKYSNATIPIAVGVSYIKNGMHYANIRFVTVVLRGSSNNYEFYIILATITVIIIITALIVISIAKHSKRKRLEGKASQ
ncbi:MAG: hypothetical protein ACP5K5_01660 [Candidatus Micrarchaeia archaeon]